MANKNDINYYFLNKREKVVIDNIKSADDILSEKVSKDVILGFATNLAGYGYKLDNSVISALSELSEQSVVKFYNSLIDIVKEIKGDDVDHSNVLFKNFPDSCRRVDINTLSSNRFASYYIGIFDEIFETNYLQSISFDGEEVEERKSAEIDKLRTIYLGTEEEFKDITRNLLSGRNAMSSFDKEIVDFTLENYNSKDVIPNEIPFKENWAYLVKKEFEGEIDIDVKFQTITDLIRCGVALSDGDVSLSEKPKFKKFKTSEIKKMLSKLEDAARKNNKLLVESMQTKRSRRFIQNVLLRGWHVDTKFKNKYPCLNKAIEKAEDEYSHKAMAEIAMSENDYVAAAKAFAMSSPGELLRHVNALLFKVPEKDKDAILKLVEKNAPKVSTKVLFDVLYSNHPESNFKVDFIKGNTAKVNVRENKIVLSKEDSEKLNNILLKVIKDQLSCKEKLGKVYIDENLKDCPVPFDTRNANGKNRSVARGTKLPKTTDKNVIRAFLYKKNHCDGFYDLSATFLNQDFSLISQCSWTQLKTGSGKVFALHSGDNIACSKGCTEFLDIDIEALKEETKYIKKERIKTAFLNTEPYFKRDEVQEYFKSTSLEKIIEDYEKDPVYGDIISNVLKDYEIRYIAFQVYAWNRVPFSNMQRVFFGIMERNGYGTDLITDEDLKRLQKIDKNIKSYNPSHELYYSQIPAEYLKYCKDYKQEDIYDPGTVEYRYDLTGPNLAKIPVVYDIQEEKYIFVDLDASREHPFQNASDLCGKESNVPRCVINTSPVGKTLMVEDYINAIAATLAAITNMNKMMLYDLFKINVEARNGEIVENVEDADIVCSVDKDIEGLNDKVLITPFDVDVIASNYLTVSKEEMSKESEKGIEKF